MGKKSKIKARPKGSPATEPEKANKKKKSHTTSGYPVNVANAREDAKAEKAKAKKNAVAKVKADAKEKAKNTAALRKLDGMADDINARIKKAAQYSGQAEDFNLSASLQLEVARRFCAEHKIPWQKWCEANIKEWAVDTIRKMIGVIKGAKTIAEAQKMVTDQREKHAAQEAGVRKRRKAAAGTRVPGKADAEPTGPAKSDFTVACEYLAGFDDRLRGQILEQAEGKLGKVVIPAEELKTLRAKKGGGGNGKNVILLDGSPPDPKKVRTAFLAMKQVDKVMFVKGAADIAGLEVVYKEDTMRRAA